MVDYRPQDVTEEARRIAAEHPTGREPEHPSRAGGASNRTERVTRAGPAVRRVAGGALDARRGHRITYVRVPDDRTLLFGKETIDLVAVEQLASRAQTRAIGLALAYLAERMPTRGATIPEALDLVDAGVAEGGLDALAPWKVGDLAEFRRHELAAALNRLRGLRVE
jgi:predicted ABC-class ATPase